MSQNSRLLTYLEQHGDITRGEAFMELGIANLWARVLELEARGWKFDRKSVQVPVRGGGYTTVTRYTLVGQPGQGASPRPVQPPSAPAPTLCV